MKPSNFSKLENFNLWEKIKDSVKNSHLEMVYLDEERLQDATDFYNEYFGYKEHPIDRAEVLAYSHLGTRINADYWKSISPGIDEQKIDFFYKTSPFHFFNNIMRFMDGMHREIAYEIENNYKPPFLDFAGGTGGLSLHLAKKGWDVTYCDSSIICNAWMKWVCNKRGINVNIVDTPKEKYNFIAAKDVIEHVTKPLELMKFLHSLLTPEGRMIVTHYPCEGPDEMAPMHFKVGDIIKEYDELGNKPTSSISV